MENQNTIEIAESNVIETALAKENVTNQVIEKLKADYMGLTINGLDDKAGFKAVEEARKECKSLRVITTKICKLGREKAIKEQKDWITKEKEVVAEIEKVEGYLESQSDAIKELEKQILFEAAQKAKLPARIEKLKSIDITVNDEELLKINDEQFGALYNELYEKFLEEKAELIRKENERQAEIKRAEEAKRLEEEKEIERKKNESIAIENAKLKAEAEAKEKELEAERKKQAEILAEQKAKSEAEFKAIQEKVRLEKLEAERLAKIESDKQAGIIRKQKEESDKLQAELKAKADAEEAILKEVELAKEKLLNAGDKEKLVELGKSMLLIKFPEMKSKKNTEALLKFKVDFDNLVSELRTLVSTLK